MTETEGADRAKDRAGRRSVNATWSSLILVVVVVAVVVLWQAALYIGLFAWVAEWQFARFGQWLPAFSFLVFLAIPALLVGLLVWLIRRRKRAEAPPADLFAQWMGTAEAFGRMMNGIALALVVIATVVVIFGFITANSGRPARMADGGMDPAGIKHGTITVVHGQIDRTQTATLTLDLLYFERDMQFAPVIDPAHPGTVRYFAEIPGYARWFRDHRGETLVYSGQVPGPIRALYSSIGYRVPADVQLLNGSLATVLWPYLTGAVHLVLGALIALAIARLQHQRIKRARERADLDAQDSERLPTG